MWHGKHHMKVSGRQQILLPCRNPSFTVGNLALGTMAVPAGVIADTHMAALITPVCMSAHSCCTAPFNSIKRTQMMRKGMVLRFKCCPVTGDDVRQLESWFTHALYCTSCPTDYVPVGVLCRLHADRRWWYGCRCDPAIAEWNVYRYRLPSGGWHSYVEACAC